MSQIKSSDFYIFLESTDEPSTNIPADFKNLLATPITLENLDLWEVALSDLIYTNNFEIVSPPAYKLSFSYEKLTKKAGDQDVRQSLDVVFKSEKRTNAIGLIGLFQKSQQILQLYIDGNRRRFALIPSTKYKSLIASIEGKEGLDFFINELGFSQLTYEKVFQKFPVVADSAPKFGRDDPAIFIYCNIIQYQLVGDTRAPLLATTPFHSQFEHVVVHEEISKRSYLPVATSYISEIGVSMRDDKGNVLKSASGKTFIKLHFRRK